MDYTDELQQERDINAALTKQLNTAHERIKFLESELATAQSKAVYAAWGNKRTDVLNIKEK